VIAKRKFMAELDLWVFESVNSEDALSLYRSTLAGVFWLQLVGRHRLKPAISAQCLLQQFGIWPIIRLVKPPCALILYFLQI